MTIDSLFITSLDLLPHWVRDKCRRRRQKELEWRSEEREHRLSEISTNNRRLSEQSEAKKKKASEEAQRRVEALQRQQ